MADERTKPPLVAVVTPVYNGAEFLAEAMDCVQAQSYPDLVHVVLDNASTDATAEIIARFKNARVPVITARNDALLSMDDNWNKALTLIPAGAKYFTILCADDIIYPTGVALMAELAERDDAVGAVTAAGFLNDRPREYGWPRDRDIFDGQEAIRMYFKTEVIFEARHALFRTTRLAHAVPFFDSSTGHSSDIDAVLREIAHCKIGFVHAPVTMVREHGGNMSEQVMRPLASHFNDWQILLERYAPLAFNGTYNNLYRRYRRHYIQKLLRWRLVEHNDRAFTWHRARLRETRRDFQAWEYADAGVDYVMKRLRLRDHWYKYP